VYNSIFLIIFALVVSFLVTLTFDPILLKTAEASATHPIQVTLQLFSLFNVLS